MKRMATTALSLLFAGCVASSVSPGLDRQLSSEARDLMAQDGFSVATEVVRTSVPFAGAHCFEPMLYVLSLGIIPAHCKDSYILKADFGAGKGAKTVEQAFEVTTMQGWLMILYPLLPDWEFGENHDAPERARNTVINREAAATTPAGL